MRDLVWHQGKSEDADEEEEVIECINITNLEYNKDAIRRRKAGAIFIQ